MKMEKNLNKEQLEAVKHDKGPLLIIAGAGTGKTTVITERIKYLILDKKIPPSEILALTFTEKASNEMEERVDIELPYGYTQMWISTFHSFCDRILRREAIHIGLNPSYKLLSEAESVLLLRQNLFKFDLKYFRPLGNPNKFLEAMLSHFSRLKDEDVSPEQYAQWLKRQKPKNEEEKEDLEKYAELSKAYKTYEELKIKEGVMDFSDLISNTLQILRTRKRILAEYQEQFKYILVDEFQDTNFSQNELSVLLAGPKKNITVVGDDDQSIYRFRGSSLSNIIQFKKRFPKAKIITLTKNYRSTKEILDRSYGLIQFNNPDRLEVKEKVNKKLISVRNITGDKVEFNYTDRVENEAEFVTKKIKEIKSAANYEYKDFAILVRANDHSEPFVRALERNRIPYQFLGPGRLFQQEEIKNLIAYLKVLYNFEDSASLFRVLNIPIFNFEGIEIAALLNMAKRKNYSLFEAMEKVDDIFLRQEAKEKIKKITEMIKKHIKLIQKETAGQILYYFIQDSGILNELIKDKYEKEAKNIAKLFDKLKTYEVEHKTASIFEVVDWIDLSMQMGESPLAADTDWSENNAVNILTVHSSKGLEFPVIFLVNLVAQRFPTRERRETIPIPQQLIKEILPQGDYHLEEERRLFYVGMTRAKDKLFLTASNFYGEGKRERKISPFIYEAIGTDKTNENLSRLLKRTGEGKEIQLSLLEWSEKKQEKPEEKAKVSNPITYLSYSQIQTFEICPLHYKLKYIFKIPTPQSPSQSFGTSVHSALRDSYQFLSRKTQINPSEIVDILKNDWINEGYHSKEHEKEAFEKAKKIVLGYLKDNFDKKNLPLALELPFNFFVKDIKIGGRIDRIDNLGNGKIEIIDYKTGNNVPSEKDLKEDKQLTLYALAATIANEKILNKKPEDISLSLFYLERNQKLTTQRTKEQLEEAKQFLIEKAEEIEKSDFLCSKNMLCKTCEYKILCSTNN